MQIPRDQVLAGITEYVEREFLGDSEVSELTPQTPLLEWGVLNSMNTAMLLSFIRTEYGVAVPPTHITGRHFHSLEAITALVVELTAQAAV
ncbi:phosphopantetheine-binding protein [Streptomyces sp.]|uniref:phosphopantetheine-binding protein n=1 Tax=Streptomyces sp. TaxID=1931 RepID=UPI002F3EDEA7